MSGVSNYIIYEKIWCPNPCAHENMTSHVRTYITKKKKKKKKKLLCPIHVAHKNMMSRVRTYVTSKMCYVPTYATKLYNVRTYVTHEYEVFSFWTYITYENNMSGPMLHTKISCLVSELIFHTKMCNDWTHVTHENMILCIRTYVTYKMCNVRTYFTHEYDIDFCLN